MNNTIEQIFSIMVMELLVLEKHIRKRFSFLFNFLYSIK